MLKLVCFSFFIICVVAPPVTKNKTNHEEKPAGEGDDDWVRNWPFLSIFFTLFVYNIFYFESLY